jgi:hypothetical protein
MRLVTPEGGRGCREERRRWLGRAEQVARRRALRFRPREVWIYLPGKRRGSARNPLPCATKWASRKTWAKVSMWTSHPGKRPVSRADRGNQTSPHSEEVGNGSTCQPWTTGSPSLKGRTNDGDIAPPQEDRILGSKIEMQL